MTQQTDQSFEGVGVIVPPSDVRDILETTASFVGKKPALEARVLQKHENDARFSFLLSSNPYHAYYRKRVLEVQESLGNAKASENGKSSESGKQNGTSTPGNPPQTSAEGKELKAITTNGEPIVGKSREPEGITTQKQAVVSLLKSSRAKEQATRPEPTDPPPDDMFTLIDVNPQPSALTLDVMKLAAQFVARHGPELMATLSRKESRNSLFEFLKPLHPHFIAFQRLVDAYKMILDNGKRRETLVAKLKEQATSPDAILNEVWYMHDWECQKAEREHEAEMDESEKIRTAQIDWYDFVVLETIEFDEDEEGLPAPVADAEQLPKILAAAKKAEVERVKNRRDVDMEVDTVTEVPQPKDARVETVNVDVDIPADRIRRAAPAGRPDGRPTNEATVVLPSGQRVPLSQAESSMRAELLNPAYKDERARAAEKNRLENLAGGEEMARNLARWDQAQKEGGGVYNRGDLQEALSGKPKSSFAEADKRVKKADPSGPKLPSGRDANDAPPPVKRARVEAAVVALSKAPMKNEDPDLAAASNPVTENRLPGLISADEWLKKKGNTSQVRIKLPTHHNKDWNLQGQEIEMTAPLKKTVAKLKSAIAKFAKLPSNKQKLFVDGLGFLKDGMTLGYYNIDDGTIIALEVKERGGRKKH